MVWLNGQIASVVPASFNLAVLIFSIPKMQRISILPSYLFVLPWSLEHLGGVNQVVLNLAREMKVANRYEPIVLILDWEATSPVFEEIHGIATVRWRIRPYTKSLTIKYKLMHWWWEIGFCKRFRAFCDENKVAVINAHYPNPAVFTLARVLARLGLSVPILSSFHGADLTAIKDLDSSTQIEWRHFVRNKSKVVVCSSALKTKVEQEFGSKVNPFIVHNGLDADSFVATAEKDEEPESPYILSIGKFERKKGQDVLIKAFANLVNNYPDLRLKLVGASDAMLPELERLCIDLNIQDRVDFYPDTPHSEAQAMADYTGGN